MPLNNLLQTQRALAEEIWSVYESGFLPNALLFSGKSGSSRLTGALDLAFTLTHEENRRELLSSERVIYFPSRKLSSSLHASIELFRVQRTKSSRVFMIESIRKALLQYNGALLDAYDSKTQSLFGVASSIDEALLEAEADRDYSEKECDELCSFLNKALFSSSFLTKGKKSNSITIDEIRAIKEWMSDKGDDKVAIFENVEDSTDAAKNSLLKLLEEPNENSHLILISKQPQRLLPTILSRVRKFNFPELSSDAITDLINRKFSLYGSKYTSFEAFYFEKAHGEEVKDEMNRYMNLFCDSLMNKTALSLEDEEKLIAFLDKADGYLYFREALTNKLESLLFLDPSKRGKLKRIYSLFNSWQTNRDVFNLSDRMALDLALREAFLVK